MRFVILLGMFLIAQRITPFPSHVIGDFAMLLLVMAGFDLVDFIMNIIQTLFKRKTK